MTVAAGGRTSSSVADTHTLLMDRNILILLNIASLVEGSDDYYTAVKSITKVTRTTNTLSERLEHGLNPRVFIYLGLELLKTVAKCS